MQNKETEIRKRNPKVLQKKTLKRKITKLSEKHTKHQTKEQRNKHMKTKKLKR